MYRRRLLGLLLGGVLVVPTASAQEQGPTTIEITLERALTLARQQAPALATARARTGEARSAVDAASVRRENPEIQATVGPRFHSAGTTVDWSAGAQQWLELGGKRGHRIDAARAGVDAAQAHAEDAERLLLGEVAIGFAHALYWQERVALAQENLRIAEEIERVARRRHEVGDAGGLEESVAALALTRTRADEARARAELGRVEGRLKVLLGLEAHAAIIASGDLRQLGMPGDTAPADLEARPDVRALHAEIRQADAEAALGRAQRVPDVALDVSYAREESADIVQAGVSVALPFFNRGQGTRAVAHARRTRAEAELDERRRRAAIEVRTAAATARQLSAAARQFEDGGLETLERAERVATASYEAGAIPLGELLAVRRELVQARLDHADLLLGAASARIELIASQGGFR